MLIIVFKGNGGAIERVELIASVTELFEIGSNFIGIEEFAY